MGIACAQSEAEDAAGEGPGRRADAGATSSSPPRHRQDERLPEAARQENEDPAELLKDATGGLWRRSPRGESARVALGPAVRSE